MKKLLRGVLVAVGLCIGMAGCESNDCMLSSESYCSMSFVDGKGNAVKLLDTLSVLVNLYEYDKCYVYHCDTDTVVLQEPVDSLVEKGYELSLLTQPKQGRLLPKLSLRIFCQRMRSQLSLWLSVEWLPILMVVVLSLSRGMATISLSSLLVRSQRSSQLLRIAS